MIAAIYGFAVLAAGWAALRSKCDLIQRVMFTLFAGWLMYVNAQPLGFAARVELNLWLDIIQAGAVSLFYLSWRECKQAAVCSWVCVCFAVMLILHTAQLAFEIDLYVYYLSCNVLFASQLIAVMYYARQATKSHNDNNDRAGRWTYTSAPRGSKPELKLIQTK